MAEVTLAAIPLTIKLLSQCLQGYKIFTQAKGLGNYSQKLLWKFRIQEARLRLWAREWGILEGTVLSRAEMRDDHDHNIVSETLTRIVEVFEDYEKLKSRYGLSLVTDNSSQSVPTSLGEFRDAVPGNIDRLLSNELRNFMKIDTGLQIKRNQSNNALKKFRWAVSDSSKFELLIKDLKDCNDGLYILLSTVERRQLRQALTLELVPGESVESLRQLALAVGTETSINSAVNLRIETSLVENEVKTSPTGSKITTSPTENAGNLLRPWEAMSSAGSHSLLIPGKDIIFNLPASGIPRFQERALATYRYEVDGKVEPRVVLVEWKSYDKDLDDKFRLEQLARLDSLARLLHLSSKPVELHTPTCAGYIMDDWHPRIGFIFEVPSPGSSSRTPLTSLYDSLGQADIPFVGDRFHLAYQLSLSVCLLHTVGWLHKGIRSECILFLDGNESSHLQIGKPYLLGFEYSRPGDPSAHSDTVKDSLGRHNLYRHPKAQGPAKDRFHRKHDIYALGIVLMEIGFWRKCEEYWHESYTPELFTEDLCNFHVPKLGGRMGKIYMDVVSTCLKGDWDDGSTNEREAQLQFFWKVVSPLSKLVA